jgi:hypothetical protein
MHKLGLITLARCDLVQLADQKVLNESKIEYENGIFDLIDIRDILTE